MTKILCALLGAAFIVMKIIGVINWDWFFVIAPVWGYGIIWFCFLCLGIMVKREEEKQPADNPRYKSKWEQRMAEMQGKQKAGSN